MFDQIDLNQTIKKTKTKKKLTASLLHPNTELSGIVSHAQLTASLHNGQRFLVPGFVHFRFGFVQRIVLVELQRPV